MEHVETRNEIAEFEENQLASSFLEHCYIEIFDLSKLDDCPGSFEMINKWIKIYAII